MELKSYLHPLVAFLRKKKMKAINQETGWTFKSVVRLLRRREKSLSPADRYQTEFSRSPRLDPSEYTDRYIMAPTVFRYNHLCQTL